MIRKIAWLTPWNDQSAIAKFSDYIIRELQSRELDVKVFRTETGPALASSNLSDAVPVSCLKGTQPKKLVMEFDAIVANIGDHYPFHGALPRLLDAVPSFGIFHDGFLVNLAAPWADAEANGSNGSVSLTEALYGANFERTTNSLAELATTYPMLEWLAPKVSGAILHSHHWADRLKTSCSGNVTVQPLAMPDEAVPDPPQNASSNIVVATIGDVNRNKQPDQVLRAIASQPVLRERCSYKLIGRVDPVERKWLEELASNLDIPAPTFTGWVTDKQLIAELSSVDVISCLRYPILEGGSASLITAMRSHRPVMVSHHGVYAEVPSDLVLRCTPGAEAEDIASHLSALIADRSAAGRMAQRARTYALDAFSSSRYVDGLLPALSEAVRQSPAIELAKRTGYLLGSLGVCRNSAVGQRLADHIWHNFGEGGYK